MVRSDATDTSAIEVSVEEKEQGDVVSSKKPSVVSPTVDKELKKVFSDYCCTCFVIGSTVESFVILFR